MTLDELARFQAAFGAQLGAAVPDAARLAAWLGGGARNAAGLARYAQSLHRHQARSLALVFPVLRALGGAPWFEALAHAYGDAYPSRSPDLGRFGVDLPAFLGQWAGVDGHRYFADVARLEWLLHEVHGSRDAVALDVHEVCRAGPARLGAWRLCLHPAVRLFRSEWRVAAIWLAHAEPGVHAMPAGAAGATRALAYRTGWRVRLRELGAGEARALEALDATATLGEALAAAQGGGTAGDPAALFTRWLAEGILVRAEVAPDAA